MFDYKDSGLCTLAEFKRVISTMFTDVVTTDEQIQLLLRLVPPQSNDGQLNYKNLCKFLEKRFVRSFKHVNDSIGAGDDQNETAIHSHRNQTPEEIEMERPLVKEASLNYILRKSADLQIDLRKEFVTADPLELSVLPRVKMWTILINLPLGLNDTELTEIFENDLNFDNYGNVDYMGILNSNIFAALEMKRLRQRALEIGKRFQKNSDADDALDQMDQILEDEKEEERQEELRKMNDNRKVVVEDLVYIDDLQVLIYTTIAPKTSQIFITSLNKVQANKGDGEEKDSNVINLHELTEMSKEKKAEMTAKLEQEKQQNG